MIKMNFNAWNIVKRIPVGTIKSYELVEGALKMKLSYEMKKVNEGNVYIAFLACTILKGMPGMLVLW